MRKDPFTHFRGQENHFRCPKRTFETTFRDLIYPLILRKQITMGHWKVVFSPSVVSKRTFSPPLPLLTGFSSSHLSSLFYFCCPPGLPKWEGGLRINQRCKYESRQKWNLTRNLAYTAILLSFLFCLATSQNISVFLHLILNLKCFPHWVLSIWRKKGLSNTSWLSTPL